MPTPRSFISYTWDSDEHRRWVRDFATRLRADGIEALLDQWELAPGDQLPAFMERAVRESDFVLIICSPKYKERSDRREGGAGYEGDIMTAEVFTGASRRKFIPVLRCGAQKEAIPSWLLGSVYISLRGDPYSEDAYRELLATLHRRREAAPPVVALPALAALDGAPVPSGAAQVVHNHGHVDTQIVNQGPVTVHSGSTRKHPQAKRRG
jgi:hypothetical protein